MNILLLAIPLITAIIFFLLIPGVGAFIARSHWRKFRVNILHSTTYPYLEYSDIINENSGGSYRFIGSLEAIEGKNKIWVKGGNLSIAADVENIFVYILPSLTANDEAQRVPWKSISSLIAGTQILISGNLAIENNRGIFKDNSDTPLLIVIFDGDKETLLKRAITGGRKKNEYWNQFTLISLVTGSFILLSISYFFFRNPLWGIPSFVSLSLSLYPIAILAPPGVIFFFLYQYFWKKARKLRIDRDLFRIPVFPFGSIIDKENRKEVILSNGEKYVMLNVKSAEKDKYLKENTSIEIRRCSSVKISDDDNLFIFGTYSEEENYIASPRDKMHEYVMIIGNPEIISGKCQKKSTFFTYLAGIFITLDVGINLLILLSLLYNYTR
jgi:hypothetical protein